MRRIICLICCLCLAIPLFACGSDGSSVTTSPMITVPGTEVTYTVYVEDAEGNPLAGIVIQFCDEANICRLPVTTDAEGKVVVTYAPADYHVTVTAAPEGWIAEADGYYFKTNETELTITLKKNT